MAPLSLKGINYTSLQINSMKLIKTRNNIFLLIIISIFSKIIALVILRWVLYHSPKTRVLQSSMLCYSALCTMDFAMGYGLLVFYHSLLKNRSIGSADLPHFIILALSKKNTWPIAESLYAIYHGTLLC